MNTKDNNNNNNQSNETNQEFDESTLESNDLEEKNSESTFDNELNSENKDELKESTQEKKHKNKKHKNSKKNKHHDYENNSNESNADESQNNSNENEELLTKYQRLAADFQNYKRRTEEEKSKTYSNATADFAEKIIPVLDNLERALHHKDEDGNDETILSGIEMIYKSLQDVLKEKGVEEIICEGLTLDPNLHHAVNKVKRDDVEPETIIEVLQKGYILKDKVIRPSMVVVSE